MNEDLPSLGQYEIIAASPSIVERVFVIIVVAAFLWMQLEGMSRTSALASKVADMALVCSQAVR